MHAALTDNYSVNWMCERTSCVAKCCNGCEYGWCGM